MKDKLKKLEWENAALRHIASDLHWMARRYADGRQSYATSLFNEHVRALLRMGVTFNISDKIIWARDVQGRNLDGLSEEEATEGTPGAMGQYKACCDVIPELLARNENEEGTS